MVYLGSYEDHSYNKSLWINPSNNKLESNLYQAKPEGGLRVFGEVLKKKHLKQLSLMTEIDNFIR